MLVMRKKILVPIMVLFFTSPVFAEYWCKAVALRNTYYNESPGTLIRKGQIISFTSDYGSDLCQHGGWCVKRKDLKLLDCDYHLNPIRTKADPTNVRHSDIEDTLLSMGLCSACADNAAAWYIRRPSSSTAKLVRSALEGNPIAKRKLQSGWDNIPNFPY